MGNLAKPKAHRTERAGASESIEHSIPSIWLVLSKPLSLGGIRPFPNRIEYFSEFLMNACRTIRRLKVSLGELQESGPVGSIGVAAGVIAEGDLAGGQRRVRCGHFG